MAQKNSREIVIMVLAVGGAGVFVMWIGLVVLQMTAQTVPIGSSGNAFSVKRTTATLVLRLLVALCAVALSLFLLMKRRR